MNDTEPAREHLSSAEVETRLVEDIAGFSRDPLGFVLFAYPWGQKGSPLADKSGPDQWQVDCLTDLRDGLEKGYALGELMPIMMATASGHGIGKSCLVAWVAQWAICTFEDTKGVITANTDTQLKTKTWPELAKWFGMLICRHWFSFTATAMFSIDKTHEKTWRIDQVPWSDTNTEAFAGLHNEGKRILLIMDEASSISDKVFEVAEGALTDNNTEIFWLVFGNPTRNTGRFRECFGSRAHRWITRQIDSRTVKITNKRQIQRWVDDYGEDSDFVRVRVRGVFPRAGSTQFVPSDIVTLAMSRPAVCDLRDPLVFGVDIARHGDDKSVIYSRKGRDGRTFPIIKLRIPDTMALAARIAMEVSLAKPDGVMVDVTGIGWGVFDRLMQLNVPGLFPVTFGASPDKPMIGEVILVANKRTEIWASMRDWLKAGAIPNDPELEQDLVGVQYGFANREDKIQLEKKRDMKKRGLASPDVGDALALTFAYPIFARNAELEKLGPYDVIQRKPPYDPLNEDWGRSGIDENW